MYAYLNGRKSMSVHQLYYIGKKKTVKSEKWFGVPGDPVADATRMPPMMH